MKLVFLSMVHLDTIQHGGTYGDLLKEFRDQGHQVTIVYPCERKYHLPTSLEKKEGVTFLSVRSGNLMNVNLLEKGLATITLESLMLRAVKHYLADETFDLILYATPPITLSRVIAYLKQRDQAVTYLLLKDIFPQNAVDLGMFSKSSLIYRYFRHKEQQLYQLSDYIGCMSPANLRYLLEHNPEFPSTLVEVSPNTITPSGLIHLPSNKQHVRHKYSIPANKTIFMYGGNLGKPQGIDFLIDCLQRNEQNEHSFILIVGEGTEYHKLQDFFDTVQPTNARLLNSLMKAEYETLLSACDVGLIFLDYRFTIPNFPSRLLSYMQASLPVLAATDASTDIGDIIEEGKFGLSCLSNNVEQFNQQINRLTNENIRREMGLNAKYYLEAYYTSQIAYGIIMKHFDFESKR